MTGELIINVTSQETRVALIENGQLCELHIERNSEKGLTGNIYKGKVQRVLPGMQAAFVDIGLSRSAFLYVDDVYESSKELEQYLDVFQEEKEILEIDEPGGNNTNHLYKSHLIEEILFEGKELLVQVIKDPIGTKGARISSHISLPSHYIVLLPTLMRTGISRRISDETKRERLQELIPKLKVENCGTIFRTASEEASEEELAMDRKFLLKLWAAIEKRVSNAPAPCLIHEDLSVALRAIRDLYNKEVKKVIVDCPKTYSDIITFIETFMPQLKKSVSLYEGDYPVFDSYGIEVEISRALGKSVWLKSGGYIVIEETEALVVIDVNTGKYVGKENQADTILQTNLDAIKEIAYQIRLRNLGGIIIIDFIDMDNKSDRERVLLTLKDALANDRAKTNVVGMSDLGLVQMTRKRTRENLSRMICDTCPYCEGGGSIKSIQSIAYDIIRSIKRETKLSSGSKILVSAHPDIVSFLYDEERYGIENLEKTLNIKIIIKANPETHHEKFDIVVITS